MTDIPSRILCIAQLDITNTNDLYTIFSNFGHVENVRISPERKMAFIHFSTLDEAIKAKETLSNQSLKVGFGQSSVSSSPSTTFTDQEPTRALCMIYITKIFLFYSLVLLY